MRPIDNQRSKTTKWARNFIWKEKENIFVIKFITILEAKNIFLEPEQKQGEFFYSFRFTFHCHFDGSVFSSTSMWKIFKFYDCEERTRKCDIMRAEENCEFSYFLRFFRLLKPSLLSKTQNNMQCRWYMRDGDSCALQNPAHKFQIPFFHEMFFLREFSAISTERCDVKKW